MVFTRKHGDFHGRLLLVSGRVYIYIIYICQSPSLQASQFAMGGVSKQLRCRFESQRLMSSATTKDIVFEEVEVRSLHANKDLHRLTPQQKNKEKCFASSSWIEEEI